MALIVSCGDDDDDDDDDTSGDDDDDDSTGAVDQLIEQAEGACLTYWQACEYEDAETLCSDWVEGYRPAMEAYADTMDMDCMMSVMNDFFTCVGGDCDPEGAWETCNAQVEQDMLQCFE